MKHVLYGVQIPHVHGQVLGDRTCPGMPYYTAVCCAKMTELIYKFAIWVVDSGGPKEAQVQ